MLSTTCIYVFVNQGFNVISILYPAYATRHVESASTAEARQPFVIMEIHS